MTSISDVCGTIYDLVGGLGDSLSEFDTDSGLHEQARLMHRLLRRLEAFLTSVQSHLKEGVRVWGSLRELEGTLTGLLQFLAEECTKGPLVQYLRADRTLACFSAATARLDTLLEKLQCEVFGNSGSVWGSSGARSVYGNGANSSEALQDGSLTEEAQAHEELCCLRTSLQTTRFALSPEHRVTLQRFRTACDSLQSHFHAMLECYGGIMDQMQRSQVLSKEGFVSLIQELQQEVDTQQLRMQTVQSPAALRNQGRHGYAPSRGDSLIGYSDLLGGMAQWQQQLDRARQCEADQHYMRMLMDVVRACHINGDCEAPLEFICPLTHRVMQEPVLLHETGHSYEKKALEEWWAKGHRFCPRTGVHIRRMDASPNHNLRSAIQRWHLQGDLHLSFRPVLNTLASQNRQQQSLLADGEPRRGFFCTNSLPARPEPELTCADELVLPAERSGSDPGISPRAAEAAGAAGGRRREEGALAGTCCLLDAFPTPTERSPSWPVEFPSGAPAACPSSCGRQECFLTSQLPAGSIATERSTSSASTCEPAAHTPSCSDSSASTHNDGWERAGRSSPRVDTPQRSNSQDLVHAHSLADIKGGQGNADLVALGCALSSPGLLRDVESLKQWTAATECARDRSSVELLGPLC